MNFYSIESSLLLIRDLKLLTSLIWKTFIAVNQWAWEVLCMAVRYEGWLGPESWIKNAGRDKTDTGQDGQSGGVRRILSAWPRHNFNCNILINGKLSNSISKIENIVYFSFREWVLILNGFVEKNWSTSILWYLWENDSQKLEKKVSPSPAPAFFALKW